MMVPGIPLHFASVLPVFGYARGVVVRSDEGRPTKIEGNENHPASLGAADAFTQAQLLSLYDPDRSQTVVNDGVVSTWDSLLTEPTTGISRRLEASLQGQQRQGPANPYAESFTSPTLGSLLKNLFTNLPQAKWYRHDPIDRSHARTGRQGMCLWRNRIAMSRPSILFDKAKVILSLDSNFLSEDPGSVRCREQFIDMAAGFAKIARK